MKADPPTALDDAIKRANVFRQRAIDFRRIAERRAWDEHSENWLFLACKADSQADMIIEAAKRGNPMPVPDFGNEPFKG